MLSSLLLLDDDEEILEFLKDELCEKYSVYTAANAVTAMNILNQHPIHLIISDVMMPDIDGFTFCSQVKKNIAFAHIPVILLTAKNTLQSKITGLEIGADAYIEKPFSPAHLQVQIANLLNSRTQLKEFFSQPAMPASVAGNDNDKNFIERLIALIETHLEDSDLDVEKLATLLNMSRPTLYRKIKTITNLTPYELINHTRLKKAAGLLASGRYRIAEIAFMTGFLSQTNFGRSFLKHYKVPPSEYAKNPHQYPFILHT